MDRRRGRKPRGGGTHNHNTRFSPNKDDGKAKRALSALTNRRAKRGDRLAEARTKLADLQKEQAILELVISEGGCGKVDVPVDPQGEGGWVCDVVVMLLPELDVLPFVAGMSIQLRERHERFGK